MRAPGRFFTALWLIRMSERGERPKSQSPWETFADKLQEIAADDKAWLRRAYDGE